MENVSLSYWKPVKEFTCLNEGPLDTVIWKGKPPAYDPQRLNIISKSKACDAI